MSDDYLWDGSGEPDPEVRRLEELLARLRSNRPAPRLPSPVLRFPGRGARGFRFLAPALAAAAAVVLLVAGAWYAVHRSTGAWEVASLSGSPRIGAERISGTGRIAVGEWLETDASSRARLRVGTIGEVVVEPNTRLRLVQARLTDQRLALARGTVRATISAPPRLFFVETPSAVAVDLGCAYTLEVDEEGVGLLSVSTGWVSFEHQGRESVVPAGARCVTRPGSGPGTPYFGDASEPFRAGLETLDFAGRNPDPARAATSRDRDRDAALDTVLAEARRRDALTLWHLLGRLEGDARARTYDRLSVLAPPPGGVTREGVLAGDRRMLELWWTHLGYESLWRRVLKHVG
jgi:hypothetical protein